MQRSLNGNCNSNLSVFKYKNGLNIAMACKSIKFSSLHFGEFVKQAP